MTSLTSLTIRRAAAEDAETIFAFIRELAAFERLLHEVEADAPTVAAALFGDAPKVFCDIALWDGEPCGFALWFNNFSTFSGRLGIYLEDLYVREAFRGRGVGKALIKALAARCVTNGWSRLQWSVLDWNDGAIAFYRSLGADVLPDWRLCRVNGPALWALAHHAAT